MLRKMLGGVWGWGDVANMVDATQDVGLGGGAKNFPRLCEKHELLHACCSHRQNEFVQTIRRHHDTCKYIQARLMGRGASWNKPFLIREQNWDKFQLVEIHPNVAMAIGSWSNRPCLYEGYWDIIVPHGQFIKRRGPDARKHSETPKNRFWSSISGTLFR